MLKGLELFLVFDVLGKILNEVKWIFFDVGFKVIYVVWGDLFGFVEMVIVMG